VGVADMAQIMAVSSSFVMQTQKLTLNAKVLGFSGRHIWQRKSWGGLF